MPFGPSAAPSGHLGSSRRVQVLYGLTILQRKVEACPAYVSPRSEPRICCNAPGANGAGRSGDGVGYMPKHPKVLTAMERQRRMVMQQTGVAA